MWGISEPQVGPPPSEKDLAVDMEIGAKYNWKYTWTVEDVSTMHCFGGVSKVFDIFLSVLLL